MRTSRPTAVGAAAIILAVLLSGCTVRIIDPTAEDPGTTVAETPAADAPATETPEGTDDVAPDDEAPDDDSAPLGGWDAEHAAHRADLLASATTTMPCPSGPLQQDGAVIRIEGACDEIRIELDAGAVIIDDVSTLLLSGSGTVVYAGTVGDVRVSGSANEIYWTGDTPQVTDTGTANVLRRG